MQQVRLIENGTICFWWVSCTNPAVSLPELHRIRSVLSQERLFLVVQDAFLTETAMLADVVLPAAMWGEKTGTLTNVDRTCHLSEKAVDPPGEARADLDIFLDYARRLELRDRDGQPLASQNPRRSGDVTCELTEFHVGQGVNSSVSRNGRTDRTMPPVGTSELGRTACGPGSEHLVARVRSCVLDFMRVEALPA